MINTSPSNPGGAELFDNKREHPMKTIKYILTLIAVMFAIIVVGGVVAFMFNIQFNPESSYYAFGGISMWVLAIIITSIIRSKA